jgi:transposase
MRQEEYAVRSAPRTVWRRRFCSRERHLVECFFNKIKHYRRIFSRFEKLAERYLGFLGFVGALSWLR